MEDKELKEMLASTKLKADDNLKNRIVHQINAEKELIPAKQKVSTTSFGNHFYILGIMYAMLLVLIGYFYFKTDGNPFQSLSFVIPALFIASTFSIYWLIIVYNESKKLNG